MVGIFLHQAANVDKNKFRWRNWFLQLCMFLSQVKGAKVKLGPKNQTILDNEQTSKNPKRNKK